MRTFLAALLIVGLAAAHAQNPPQFEMIGVDTSRANVDVDEILSGGPPPQGITALGFGGDWRDAARPSNVPRFVSVTEASSWLDGVEPVVALRLGVEARAYPLQILMFHEIVNDTVGNTPVAVTFCPLCNSALAFDRRVPLTDGGRDDLTAVNPVAQLEFEALDGDFQERLQAQDPSAGPFSTALEVTFGVSGLLLNSNLLMFDSHSSTLWAQILGEGNVGTLAGTRLLRYPAQIVSFDAFRTAFPDGEVLSRNTGHFASYGRNPYPGYDSADEPPFLFRNSDFSFKESDPRLVAQARVVTVDLGGEAVAYPFEVLERSGAVNDRVDALPVAVFWQPGTASSIDATRVAEGRDVGAVGVFRRVLDGRTLTFRRDGDAFVDDQTGSRWNLLGRAVAGAFLGSELEAVVHDNTLWFAWAAFKPETRVYGD